MAPSQHNAASTADSEFDASEFGPGGAPRAIDEPDEELMALVAPPRAQRWAAMSLMALVVALAIGLLTSLRGDISYYFASDEVVDLGNVRELNSALLENNRYVRIEGTPMASRMVQYSRVLTGSDYVIFPLAGQRTVFVQVPSEAGGLPRHFSRREYSGRLVTFRQLGGRFAAVQRHIQDTYDEDVTSSSFVLMADESPGSYGWALLLAGLCVAIILLNLGLLLRWFRPLPYIPRATNEAE